MSEEKTNWGKEAYKRGVAHANNIYKLHGIRVIRKLATYKPQNDYERGKIETASKILWKHLKKQNHLNTLLRRK